MIIYMHFYIVIYHMAQNFDRENIDEFDEFPAIRQYFPYQNFPFPFIQIIKSVGDMQADQHESILKVMIKE